MKNQGTLADLMRQRAYQQLALVPPAIWLGKASPQTPRPERIAGAIRWSLQDPRMEADVKWWLVQTFVDKAWLGGILLPVEKKEYAPAKDCKALAIRSVSLSGLTSEPAVIRLR